VVPNITLYSTALYNTSATAGQDVFDFASMVLEEHEAAEKKHKCHKNRDWEVNAHGEEEEHESKFPLLDGWFGKRKPKHPHKHHKPPVKFLRLPTLLHNHSLPIAVIGKGPLTWIKPSRYASVIVKDGLAADGVIQVVNRVLIPRHPRKKHGNKSDEAEAKWFFDHAEQEVEEPELTLEEFKERLAPFVKLDDADGDVPIVVHEETKLEF